MKMPTHTQIPQRTSTDKLGCAQLQYSYLKFMSYLLPMVRLCILIETRQNIVLKYRKYHCRPQDKEYCCDYYEEFYLRSKRFQWLLQTVQQKDEVIVGEVRSNSNNPINCRLNSLRNSVIESRCSLKYHQYDKSNYLHYDVPKDK